jgi:hypothetical protein
MLPAPRRDRPSLADVATSCLAAVRSEPGRLSLAPVRKAVIVLIDGLGADALAARAGHARTLARGFDRSSIIESGFPTTTAAALASLTTGRSPGEHGLVSYQALDPEHDRVLNLLSGWDAEAVPERWQSHPTVFETATSAGIEAVVFAPERYRGSGFTRAVLRGADYLGGQSIDDRVDLAIDWLARPGDGIGYLYIPEVDAIAHAEGWQSGHWTDRLEAIDAALARLQAALRPGVGAIVTADHGILDIDERGILTIDTALLERVRHVAGEPRAVHLHLEPGADAAAVASAWTASEGANAWIATRDEAIAADWFGPVADGVRARIGDVLVVARKGVAYYEESQVGHPMVGHHGSFAPAETRVPLIRWGAFAR